ncbi:MAG: alpha/beta hydrolase, partial [Rhodospirillales bacterium]
MKGFSAVLLALCLLPIAHAQQPQPTGLGREFSSQYLRFDGVLTHYVRGGAGPAIVLLHGFPQDWSEYAKIMPRLAKRFTIVAIDLPGIGASAPTPDRYDAAAMASRLCDVVVALNLHGAYLVGHDIGGMVAYAFVRQCPQVLRGAMILDVKLPGIAGWDTAQSDPAGWHVRFMQTPGLPEKLPENQIVGRQGEFFDYFFALSQFSRAEKAHYTQAYGTLAQLHAAFEIYRAFPANDKFNASQR